MNGYINVFKPKGMTSYDVVKCIKRILNVKKIGHAGTLDPNASGVLPICIGKATRTSEYLLNCDKSYIGELVLGVQTDTQDIDGNVTNYSDKIVEEKDIKSAFNQFKGEIYQLPPMYSALKYKGKKLYELARKGIEVERKRRKVYIYDIKILNIINNKKILFSVKCSRGTYIRTLCNDIGESLGTYGYMSYLIRTAVYPFYLSDSVSLETIKEKWDKNKIDNILYPIDYPLSNMKSVIVPDDFFKQLVNGMPIETEKLELLNKLNVDENIRVYCKDTFVGIGKIVSRNNKFVLKLNKVLI